MKGLLNWREKGYFGNKNEISIKALADWAAKGHIFLSRQHKPLSTKTIEEELGVSWFFDRADTVGQAFHMMKLSVTKFAPSQLLLIPAGKEGTAFTPYALAILAAGCIILFIVSVLQERGMKIRESLAGLSLPITVAIYFCLLASIGFFGSTAVARGFIYAQF